MNEQTIVFKMLEFLIPYRGLLHSTKQNFDVTKHVPEIWRGQETLTEAIPIIISIIVCKGLLYVQ